MCYNALAMFVTHLSLTNFRNFTRLEVNLGDGPVLFVGTNAQGKTSLLEAVYFLSGGTSPHASSDRQLINFLSLRDPQPFSRLVADIQRGGRPQRIETRLILEPVGIAGDLRLRKEILINGVKSRQSQLSGVFNAVLFLPQYMQILEGAPQERRKHLDALICQADPVYAEALGSYQKVLSQRNALLKQLQDRRGNLDQLSFWDTRFLDTAALLIQRRALTFRELEPTAREIHADLTRHTEVLQFAYQPRLSHGSSGSTQPALPFTETESYTPGTLEKIKQALQEALEANRQEEIARGITITGPHRDDYNFLADRIDLRTYGSRGQNRTALLSLMLSEVVWLRQRTGEWPVLLLDEVLAELDPARRSDLLERISAANQVMVTAADLDMFTEPFYSASSIFQIQSGKLSSMNAADLL
ncbi:MAG: DNA replication/repair protein RecF [Anaerolineales bacterium]|nr:DNA replication/repair protein RecF [Anaerolineales bacterium]